MLQMGVLHCSLCYSEEYCVDMTPCSLVVVLVVQSMYCFYLPGPRVSQVSNFLFDPHDGGIMFL